MKKVILILILVMPVVLVVLVQLLAGFVGRYAAVHPITELNWNQSQLLNHGFSHIGGQDANNPVFQRGFDFHVGQSINLRDFLYVNRGANFNELTIIIYYPPNITATSVVRDGSIIRADSASPPLTNNLVVRVSAPAINRSIALHFPGGIAP